MEVLPSVRWHVLLAKACRTPLWPDSIKHRCVAIHVLDSFSFAFRHRWCPQSRLRTQAIFPGFTLHSFISPSYSAFSAGKCLSHVLLGVGLLSSAELDQHLFLPHMGITFNLVCVISLPFIYPWSVMLSPHGLALISRSRWLCFPHSLRFSCFLTGVLHTATYYYIELYDTILLFWVVNKHTTSTLG